VGRHSKDAVTLRRLSSWAGPVIGLVTAIAVAAFLRLDALGEPSYWLDEILHQQITTDVAALPWWRWFGTLHAEHGGLYYLTQLATRVFGMSEGAGRLAAALFGIATVPLAWWCGAVGASPAEHSRQTEAATAPNDRGRWEIAGVLAAILLAVSPLHVYFSREARSYALLTFLAAALMLVLLRGRSLLAAALLLLGMLYTSAVSATIVLAAFLVAAACAVVLREERRWYATVAGFCVVTAALFRVVYAARPVTDANWPGFPILDGQFFTTLVRTFSVSALGTEIAGRTAMAMLVFALAGIVVLLRGERRNAIVIVGMTVLPLTISLAVLKTLDHFYAARYVMPAVFGYCVLAGIGIAALARWLPLALAVAVVTAVQMWPSARAEPFLKLDWRAVAATIAKQAHAGDVVMTAEPWSDVSLRYYLAQQPQPPRIVLMPYVELAERFRKTEKIWFVSAGYDDSEMRRWMCALPMVAASPLENLRVHYSGDFLHERAAAPEQRALAAAYGARGVTLSEEQFSGEGWALPEGGFRWAVGRRASIEVPRWGARDRVVRMRAMPFAQPQSMRVSVNGAFAGELALVPAWSEYALQVPARFWRNGWNTVTFDFARALAPADVDPRATDHRQLAVSFEWIAVDDAGTPPTVERTTPVAFLGHSAALLDERTLWRRGETRVDVQHLHRDEVTALLGRLGVDPEAVFPRVQRGELRLENLAARIAYGQDCADGETFLRLAFAILLDRHPSEIEKQDLLPRKSRVEIIERIVRSTDFAKKYSGPS
jgi:mannosyltransferase